MANEVASRVETKSSGARRGRSAGNVGFVAQLTASDCGAACLASILAFHGKHVPLHEVRARLGSGRNGVTARQLLQAARSFGLNGRGVAIEPSKLAYLPAASILHWDLSHYVVYQHSDAKHISFVDPAVGRRQLPLEEASKSLTGVALVFEPGERFEPQRAKRSGRLRRYASWIFGVRGVWGRILGTSLFLQVLSLSMPGLMTLLVDKVVPRGDLQLLYLVAAGCVVLSAFFFLSTLLRARLLLELRTKLEARMSFDFVEHMFALPYAFFQQRTTGDLMMRLSSQAAIRELLTTGALSALLDGTLVGLYFVLLLAAAPVLAAVAAGCALLQVVIYMFGSSRSSRLTVEALAAQSRLEAYQVEMLSGVETLKSMGATERSLSRWSDLYVDTLNRAIATGTLDGTYQSLFGVLRFCGPVCLMLVGAYKVLDGSLSLGTMLGLSALGGGFLEPVGNLVATALKLTQLHGYMERIEDVLETPRESEPLMASSDPARLEGAISVRDLSFRYPTEARPTLQHISFDVAPGQCVAIVGASGSGKSTLARLLAGLYTPEAGSIAFDGRELRAWDIAKLRQRLGIVTQDTRLFSGTIFDNVTMFDSSYVASEVESACRSACLHGAIEQMALGYETVLADGGSSLSGGQRQRLSLARALVRKPGVLILDEATSALDAVTERDVHEQLRNLRCTRVIVAHRLSTIVDADAIVVLDQGKLIDVGPHADLLARCARYRELVRSQLGLTARPSAPPPVPDAARSVRSPRAAVLGGTVSEA